MGVANSTNNQLTYQIDDLKLTDAVETTNWGNLPFEMKEMVVRRMDIVTRTCLKLCSKADKYLVESTPVHFMKVEAVSDDTAISTGANLRFAVDNVKFEQNGANLTIFRNGKEKRITMENGEKTYDLTLEYFKSIVFEGKVRIDECSITRLEYPPIACTPTTLIKVKKLDGVFMRADDCYKWLQHFAPNVSELSLMCCDRFSRCRRKILMLPVVMNARKITIECCEIDNEDIQYLRATDIRIVFSSVGNYGLKKLIKKWMDDDYPKIGSSIKIENTNAIVRHRDVPINIAKLINKSKECEEIYAKNKAYTLVLPIKNKKFMILTDNNTDIHIYIAAKCPYC